MKHRVFWVRFFLVASILTAILIFWFSTQEGAESQQLSDGVTLQVAKVVKPDFEKLPEADRISYLSQLGLIVRKNAHFGEFALLGFNLLGWLKMRDPKRRWRACQLPAWVIATLYAGTDELHQRFISQRVGAPLDVAIDSAGALTGVLVATLVLFLALRRREPRYE